MGWQVPEEELEFHAMRAQGAGGQNVNKVSSAVHLRWDIAASSVPDAIRQRLLERRDRRISEGVLVLKAQRHRTQEANRADALQRLGELLDAASVAPVPRKATKPTRSSQRRRVEAKVHRGKIKALRSGNQGD